jgi:uncharacterized protein YndB with AHSA1/START domain
MSTTNANELVLTRTLDASPDKVYRCWTEPELMKKWFAPRPWTTPVVEVDLRPGGASNIVMRSPEGKDFPNPGVYLEVVPNEKIVFTDAFGAGWAPAGEPFFVAEITLQPVDGGKRTLYTAKARHWTQDACERHVKMGFHEGWGMCATQLEEIAKSL